MKFEIILQQDSLEDDSWTGKKGVAPIRCLNMNMNLNLNLKRKGQAKKEEEEGGRREGRRRRLSPVRRLRVGLKR